MRVLRNFLASLMLAGWLIAIAVLSIQNVTPISLRFFTWQSVELPFGVALAFSVSTGVVIGAFLPLLPGGRRARSRRQFSAAAEPWSP